MEKLKKMIERNRKAAQAIYLAAEESVAEDISKILLSNIQVIEIYQESGKCKCTINRAFNCMTLEKAKIFYCSWCQGQEKINKLLEGER